MKKICFFISLGLTINPLLTQEIRASHTTYPKPGSLFPAENPSPQGKLTFLAGYLPPKGTVGPTLWSWAKDKAYWTGQNLQGYKDWAWGSVKTRWADRMVQKNIEKIIQADVNQKVKALQEKLSKEKEVLKKLSQLMVHGQKGDIVASEILSDAALEQGWRETPGYRGSKNHIIFNETTGEHFSIERFPSSKPEEEYRIQYAKTDPRQPQYVVVKTSAHIVNALT
jgi:hypothetical protein